MFNPASQSSSTSSRQIATIYVDESGNKFDKFMIQESPFFIYAWLLLTIEQEKEINLRISQLLHKERFPIYGELHAKNMWASARGLRRFNEIMKILRDSGVRAYVTFTEKRFEICVLICQTYLDYLDDTVTNFYRNFQFKKLLMNVIYQSVTDQLLNEFREACIKDDVDLLRKIGIRIAQILSLHPAPDVARSAKIFIEGSKNPFRFGQIFPDDPRNLHLMNSHMSLFSISLWLFESELESLRLKARIIRDEDSVNGETLDLVYKLLTEERTLKNLVDCQESTSKDSIGLQLADLVAGATERVLRAKSHKKRLGQTQQDIWATLRLSLVHGKWTYQLTSDSCEEALEDLWNYESLPQICSSGVINSQDPPRCSCGAIIASGKIRDYYVHVMNVHPNGAVPGLKCRICGKLIPIWLGACHEVIEHQLAPPFRGDFYSDMQKDYEVLQTLLKSSIRIAEIQDS